MGGWGRAGTWELSPLSPHQARPKNAAPPPLPGAETKGLGVKPSALWTRSWEEDKGAVIPEHLFPSLRSLHRHHPQGPLATSRTLEAPRKLTRLGTLENPMGAELC